MVCSVIHAVIHNMKALITTWNRPSVRMYSGIDSSWTIGLMNALTNPKINATTAMMPTRCTSVWPPTKLMPGTMSVTTHSASPVTATRSRKPMFR